MNGIVPDCNLFIQQCKQGTPERNAIMLATQADYAFLNGFLPMPDELYEHWINCNHAAVIRE